MGYSKSKIKDIQHEKRRAIAMFGGAAGKEIAGKFWFSRMQRNDLDKAGRHRTFAKLYSGETVEYTQMVDFESLMEDPLDRCNYVDATYMGEGIFSHFEDQ